MKRQTRYILTTLLAVLLLLPAFSAQAAEALAQDTATVTAEVTLEVLKDTSDELSATARYVNDRATIIEEEGRTFAIVQLNSSAWWQSLQTQTAQPGSFEDSNFVAAEVLSENEEEDTRVVKFEVPDLALPLNAKIHIIVTGVPGLGEYDHSYDIRLKFNAAEPEAGEEAAPEESVDASEGSTSSLADGDYTIALNALHETEEKSSSMGRYIEAPAALIVENGKQTVQLTLTDHAQITAFQIEQNGQFVDANVVRVDEAANQRVISFEVTELSSILNAKVQIYVAAQNYTGNHTIRLAFDADSVESAATAVTKGFADIESSWAKTYIEELAAVGMIQGMTEHEFSPDLDITRAQFTVMLSRALGLTEQQSEAYQGTFADVTEALDWAVLHIEAAQRAGIVTGNEGNFSPDASITRQEMVTMTIRALQYKDASLTEGVEATTVFADQASIQEYALPYVQAGVALEIIAGQEENGVLNFAPADQATRAQAAKLMHHLLVLVK